MNKETLKERADELTNNIMPLIREEFDLKEDSDRDDIVYTKVWKTCLFFLTTLKEELTK